MMNLDELFVVVRLGTNELGIPVENVNEMVMMPDVTAVPTSVPHARGVITLRDNAIPLIDFRKRFGLTSMSDEQQELIDLLTTREADHVNWLVELEDSVKEKREFKLATDPHKCNFGRWYDTFTTESLLLQSLLPKFDVPHKKIHGIAQQVVEKSEQGLHDEAMAIIERTRNGELATMIHLFGQARSIISETQRELALVLHASERQFAVSVDSVSSVETLVRQEDENMPDLLDEAAHGLLTGIAKFKSEDSRVVLLIDPGRILASG